MIQPHIIPVSPTIKTDIVLCFMTFRPLTRIALTQKQTKFYVLEVNGRVRHTLTIHLAIFRNTLQTVTRKISTPKHINQFDCPLTALMVRSCIFPLAAAIQIYMYIYIFREVSEPTLITIFFRFEKLLFIQLITARSRRRRRSFSCRRSP